jgi:anti-anti-sigma factor
MSTDWSDSIVLTELSDEPALSEDLSGLIQRVEAVGVGDDGHVPHVVLNFGGVSYVNSSNLAQLLRLRKGLEARHRILSLCSMSNDLHSVFQVTGLDRVFRIAPDPLTALAGIQIEDEGDE